MTDQNTPPPGWYPDGSGTQRYWDGTQWATASTPPAPPTGTYPVAAGAQPDKWWHNPVVIGLGLLCCSPVGLVLTWLHPKWSTKVKAIITAVVLVLAIIGGVAAFTSSDLADDTTNSAPDERDSEPAPDEPADEPETEPEPPQNPDDGVFEITVTSTGSTSANTITFMDPDGSFQMSQENGKSLPWTKRFEGIDGVPMGWNMNAQQNAGGELKCIVKLDGEVVAENTSSGSYAVVTCAP